MLGSEPVLETEYPSPGEAGEGGGHGAMSVDAAGYVSATMDVENRAGVWISRCDPFAAHRAGIHALDRESNASRVRPDARRTEYPART